MARHGRTFPFRAQIKGRFTFAAGGGAAYTLTADVGTYALTGNATALSYGRALVATVGTYTLTGNAVAFRSTRILAAGTGVYNLTGNAVSFSRLVPVTVGDYRHSLPAPILRQRPLRLSTLERQFKIWERKP